MNKTIARQLMNSADVIFRDGMVEPIVVYERVSFYHVPGGGGYAYDYEDEVEYFLSQLAATYRHITSLVPTTLVPGQGSSAGARI